MAKQLPEWLVEVDGKRYFKLSRPPRVGDTVIFYFHSSPEPVVGTYRRKTRHNEDVFAWVYVQDRGTYIQRPNTITAVDPLEDGDSP
ncbi:AMP-binding enzyme family protein-like protein [Bacillus phage Mgbh1]|uniref:AMP-binding enzyme family protein-like protein n=1 Tax=Bacillus phage Mgbh1 TaxID=1796993 RepID=A0A142F1S4_9CAUD|nr:AMP-binding enzyme family protein-like protein [Bacillus phage Mgbh1]AMQ66731.1 AMP-binding enzyme family protein-like protein [Bacillus phage Mgbh1]